MLIDNTINIFKQYISIYIYIIEIKLKNIYLIEK